MYLDRATLKILWTEGSDMRANTQTLSVRQQPSSLFGELASEYSWQSGFLSGDNVAAPKKLASPSLRRPWHLLATVILCRAGNTKLWRGRRWKTTIMKDVYDAERQKKASTAKTGRGDRASHEDSWHTWQPGSLATWQPGNLSHW